MSFSLPHTLCDSEAQEWRAKPTQPEAFGWTLFASVLGFLVVFRARHTPLDARPWEGRFLSSSRLAVCG